MKNWKYMDALQTNARFQKNNRDSQDSQDRKMEKTAEADPSEDFMGNLHSLPYL